MLESEFSNNSYFDVHLRTIESLLNNNPVFDPNSDVEKEYQEFIHQKDSLLERSDSEENLVQHNTKKTRSHKVKLNSKQSTHATDLEM